MKTPAMLLHTTPAVCLLFVVSAVLLLPLGEAFLFHAPFSHRLGVWFAGLLVVTHVINLAFGGSACALSLGAPLFVFQAECCCMP
jgi:hypothetical protein